MSTVSVFYHRPRRTFYARVYIPVSIQHFFQGRVQCWRSLGTKDKKVATVKASIWNSRLQRLFYTLQTRGHRMDQAQIEALITRWMFATLDLYEDYRAERLPGMTDDEVDDQWTGCATVVDESSGMLRSGDYQGVKGEVEELLSTNNLPALDVASPSYARLARAYLSARQRVYSVEMDRWSGDYRTSLSTATPATPAAATPSVPTKLFSEVAALYLKEHHTRRPRTQAMIQSAFRTFLKVIGGDKSVGDISKDDCRAYKSKLVGDYLKASTINKHLHSLDHLFRWAKGQGFVHDAHVNPVTGLRIAKSIQRKEASKREVYTREELQALVGHPLFQVERTKRPERWWIVWLGVYAGLRREEAAQLLVSQVIHDKASGVWYFDVVEEEGQSLKNQTASKRRVPLHAALISLGLLEYVATTKLAGHSRLFYQCDWSANGYGDAVGKWFGRLVHQTLKFPSSLVFHSFRHGFITELHAASVPDQIVLALCGHTGSGGEVHAMYTHRETFPLKVLKEAVDKLDFGLR